jgi:hypothetical protein
VTTTAAVAGISETKPARHGSPQSTSRAWRSQRASARPTVSDVDGFVSYHIEQVAEVELMTTLGIREPGSWRAPSGGAARRRCSASPRSGNRVARPSVSSRRAITVRGGGVARPTPTGGRPWARPARLATSGSGGTRSALPAREFVDRPPAHARVRLRRALRDAGDRAALPREPQSRRDHAEKL